MSKECKCPFCDCDLNPELCQFMFCQACQVKFIECKVCGKLFSDKLKACPNCGEKAEPPVK